MTAEEAAQFFYDHRFEPSFSHRRAVDRSRLQARSRRVSPARVMSPLLVLGFLSASTAWAQSVAITPGPGVGTAAEELGLSSAEIEVLVQEEVAALFGLLDVGEFLRLSANAQAVVSSGQGADYASNPTSWYFGLGASAALDAASGDLRASTEDLEGEVPFSAGAMVSMVAGYNFSEQGVDWLTASIHGMYLPLDLEQFEGEFFNLGFRAQAKAVPGAAVGGLQAVYWGGLDFTTGYSFALTTLSLGGTHEAGTRLREGVVLDTSSIGLLELRQIAHTIPVELTTNLSFFEVLTLYGGFGLDFALGRAEATMDLDSELGGMVAGEPVDLGRAVIVADGRRNADLPLTRGIVGLQINLWSLRVFAQLNLAPRNSLVGAAAGLKYVL